MHRSIRSKILTATVTARHTPDEEQQIRARADVAGSTVSEWARETHLQALSPTPDIRLLLAELLAFRRLFLALEVDAVQGKAPTQERLREVMDESERTKFEMADKRISGLRDLANKKSANPRGESN